MNTYLGGNIMEQLKEIILKSIELYNSLEGVEKVALIEEEKLKNMPINGISLTDVEKLYICQYDDNQVGLFRKIDFSSNKQTTADFFNTMESWKAGMIFLGYKSDCVGMKITHEKTKFCEYFPEKGYYEVIDEKRYVVNCNMHRALNFDNMRQIMYENGELEPFTNGVATNEDIAKVLKYSRTYFNQKTKQLKK